MVHKNTAAPSSASAPALKRRKRKTKTKRPPTDRASSATVVGECDDIIFTILARLPARTAIACTALSKHHRSLIRSPEFRSLHCRLGAPLLRPHIAYLAAASVCRSSTEHEYPASGYYGFHLAGAGLTGGNAANNSPIRALAGWRYLGMDYVNTCNGVLLLASEGFSDPCPCTLWNPAVADAAREVITVPKPPPSEKETSVPTVLPDDDMASTVLSDRKTQLLALGLGYSCRSNTYKLFLCRRDRFRIRRFIRNRDGEIVASSARVGGITHQFEYSLVVHSLGGGGGGDDDAADMKLRTVLPMEIVLSYSDLVAQEIMEGKSLYMDGTIYFLYWKKNVMLAFDVDNETVHTVDMPGDRQKDNVQLIEMSGRPCLVIVTARDRIALWLLTTRYELVPIHDISYRSNLYNHSRSIIGVWDCGGVLLLVLCFEGSKKGQILLYDDATKKIFKGNVPGDLAMKKSNYMLCWGYKPTLVSPRSIFGEPCQAWLAHITDVMNPLVLQDRRKGQKATLSTVCLMELLVRIMQKLPHDLQDMVQMPSIVSEEPDLLFQNVV